MTLDNCFADRKINLGNLYAGVWFTKPKTTDILQPDCNRMIVQTNLTRHALSHNLQPLTSET